MNIDEIKELGEIADGIDPLRNRLDKFQDRRPLKADSEDNIHQALGYLDLAIAMIDREISRFEAENEP